MATIWRYVYNNNGYSGFCMYGGTILDGYEKFIRKFTRNPMEFCKTENLKSYVSGNVRMCNLLFILLFTFQKVHPKLVKQICEKCKTFCAHFEKVTEGLINTFSWSGSKILDILDCATYCETSISKEKIMNNRYNAKVCLWFKKTYTFYTRNKK